MLILTFCFLMIAIGVFRLLLSRLWYHGRALLDVACVHTLVLDFLGKILETWCWPVGRPRRSSRMNSVGPERGGSRSHYGNEYKGGRRLSWDGFWWTTFTGEKILRPQRSGLPRLRSASAQVTTCSDFRDSLAFVRATVK